MASIFKDFEYDVFISYRHNDNVFDGWVTNFVAKLRQELQATVKDQLSIYIDENHEDGLLEYQNVSKSLENKLRTLIFIPVISRTYCDVEKYAWKNEFLEFKKIAATDRFGMNINLLNGNVASRILPIKIHVLDYEDTRLVENELEGNLRSIDFIYEGTDGVNRPLRPKDDELGFKGNNLLFRNQINKLANAIAELLRGIKLSNLKQTNPELIPQAFPTLTRKPSLEENQTIEISSPSITSSTLSSTSNIIPVSEPKLIEKPNVFLSWTSTDIKSKREELMLILQKAGLNVVPYSDCPADESTFRQKAEENLKSADCSVHILSGEFGRRFEVDDHVSFPMYQYELAKNGIMPGNNKFKMFIWYCPLNNPIKPEQQGFINNIRNGISTNMMFSTVPSPMQLVDDIRAVMETKKKTDVVFNETDIFFISNQLDDEFSQQISTELSEKYPIETLTIIQDRQEQYKERSAEQIKHSRLAVVYFKEAAEWAIPFVKQIWKLIGGATSKTPILLIGSDDPESNLYRTFKAPKVISCIMPNNKIVLEIINAYQKIEATAA